jgi:GNAT superfamily N-acetyltransferase
MSSSVPTRLAEHLTTWLGAWPAGDDEVEGSHGFGITVVGHAPRTEPGWDGAVHPMIGVLTARSGVLSVPPELAREIGAITRHGSLEADLAALAEQLPSVLAQPVSIVRGPFRWSVEPTGTPDTGEWIPTDDPRVPEWLKPFNGDVLVEWDERGRYGAGVGRKQHDAAGHELSVGTEEALRGRGMGRLLVATAARRVLDEGAVPTYLHAPDNFASAKVAEAAGFPDRGWTFLGLHVDTVAGRASSVSHEPQ